MEIPKDKQLHFVAGIIIALITIPIPILYSFLIVCTAAIGKEVYDKVSGKGNCEILDAMATIVGGIIVILLRYLF